MSAKSCSKSSSAAIRPTGSRYCPRAQTRRKRPRPPPPPPF
jgi:hypothetical protein